ncbi:hypothetical protein AUR65_008915 [Haloferax marisrubri]|uniref:Sulfatase N-terminal domain-containing protein n=2 Tax=Haloferax marisrubri TaxID=1544719 RepID=A0A2P4NS61_9EURY|nr:hypothetical protein AUR65_008915 [Haloferax marisrubri]
MFPMLWAEKHIDIGTNVFDKEWDLLIILDACRVDALKEVSPEFNFLDDINSIWSVGSTSKEWYANTFQGNRPEIGETALVSGNGWVEPLFEGQPNWSYWTMTRHSIWHNSSVINNALDRPLPSKEDFGEYVTVYEDRGGDCGTVALPDDVTNAAIKTGRETNTERMVVHYMQPHAPYLHERDGNKLPKMHNSPFESLRNGSTSREEVWEAYLNNLRLVLHSVENLLANIDADEVVISSDHGELFGECGLYSHIAACPHPALKRVPWVTTSAEDTHQMEPELSTEDINVDTKTRLRDLGYL